ncbi:LPS export ABC transporter periplasmic protein LptC, partial [Staphylococcus nepalensis]|nr:LPS export ABC transporter periplasmic protein LptC [Staphylococcus nepalensis]
SVKADKAKLTNDRMLYLYGHVEVNALVPDSQLRRITTQYIEFARFVGRIRRSRRIRHEQSLRCLQYENDAFYSAI